MEEPGHPWEPMEGQFIVADGTTVRQWECSACGVRGTSCETDGEEGPPAIKSGPMRLIDGLGWRESPESCEEFLAMSVMLS